MRRAFKVAVCRCRIFKSVTIKNVTICRVIKHHALVVILAGITARVNTDKIKSKCRTPGSTKLNFQVCWSSTFIKLVNYAILNIYAEILTCWAGLQRWGSRALYSNFNNNLDIQKFSRHSTSVKLWINFKVVEWVSEIDRKYWISWDIIGSKVHHYRMSIEIVKALV